MCQNIAEVQTRHTSNVDWKQCLMAILKHHDWLCLCYNLMHYLSDFST